MREFGWKFTWWCFWVWLFWITSYVFVYGHQNTYIYIFIIIHICICITILIWYTWYCIDEQNVELTHIILFMFHMIYVSLLQAILPNSRFFEGKCGAASLMIEIDDIIHAHRAHWWYRFTWYTHTGSWGSSPLVFSENFPDPSANYGEFLILNLNDRWMVDESHHMTMLSKCIMIYPMFVYLFFTKTYSANFFLIMYQI